MSILLALSFISGNELLRRCDAKDSRMFQGYCVGYVAGASSALDNSVFCIPTSATTGQTRNLVVDWLKAHPEYRDRDATALIGVALYEAWPCPKQE